MRDLILGLVMGVANVLPGISGGTIAFVSGRYSEIIRALASLLKFKAKREEIWLLTKIGVGAIVSIVALSKFIDELYQNFPAKTSSFFAGLIAGGLFFLWKSIRFNFRASLMMALGALSMFGISLLPKGELSGALWIFTGGFIAGGAMILPGISGSSMLVILGIYDDAIGAVAKMNLKVLTALGVGAVLGIFVISVLMKKLVESWENDTISFLYGLTLTGLFYVISVNSSITFLILGFLSMIALEKII